MSNVADNQFIRPTVQQPVVKMKRVKVYPQENSQRILYSNEFGRVICEIKTPPPQFWPDADCTLNPDAKLDELANVIAQLWGMLVAKHHGYK